MSITIKLKLTEYKEIPKNATTQSTEVERNTATTY